MPAPRPSSPVRLLTRDRLLPPIIAGLVMWGVAAGRLAARRTAPVHPGPRRGGGHRGGAVRGDPGPRHGPLAASAGAALDRKRGGLGSAVSVRPPGLQLHPELGLRP